MRCALIILGLVACEGGDTDKNGDSGDTCTTGIEVCVVWEAGGEAVTDGRVDFRPAGDDSSVEAQVDEDGCRLLEVEAGSWEVRGRSFAGDCISEWLPVEVADCAVEEVEADILLGCVDG